MATTSTRAPKTSTPATPPAAPAKGKKASKKAASSDASSASAAPSKPAKKTAKKKAAKSAAPAAAKPAAKPAAKAAKPAAEKPAKKGAKKGGKKAAKAAPAAAPAAEKPAKKKAAKKPAAKKAAAPSVADTYGGGAAKPAKKAAKKAAAKKAPKGDRASRAGAVGDAAKAYTDAPYVEGGGAKVARATKPKASRPAKEIASAVGSYTGGGDDDDDDGGDDDDDLGGDDDDDGLAEPSSPRASSRKGAKKAASSSRAATSGNNGASKGAALKAGDRAPAFALAGDDGDTWSLERLKGERFVLYFYPRDDTPGCTREACDFRDRHARFEDAGVRVLGVSSDSLASHGKFRGKYSLPFTLLSDPDRSVAQAFGVVGEKSMYGRKTIGVIRSTFVVGPDARIEHVVSPVRVDGHADAILQAVNG